MIDLCSGLGGASQPFIDRGWNVLRIDINPQFENMPATHIGNIKDIEKIMLIYKFFNRVITKPNFVWASPPCECFSVASLNINWTKRRKPKHKGVVDAIQNVFWCLDAIEFLNPKFWILENPRGKLRNILNKPGVIYPGLTTDLGLWGAKSKKPTDLWGVFPKITTPESTPDVKEIMESDKDNRPSKPELRAIIPYKLGETIAKAIEKESDDKITIL